MKKLIIHKSLLFMVLVCVVTVVAGGTMLRMTNQGGGQKKTSSARTSHPFAVKLNRHRSDPGQAPNRKAFQAEVASLAQRLAQSRARIKNGITAVRMQPAAVAMQRLEKIAGGSLQIRRDKKKGLPIFISGRRLQAEPPQVHAQIQEAAPDLAMRFMRENVDLLQVENPEDEFLLQDVQRDEYGFTHLRYQQVYHGLEIWARDVRVHLDAEGNVTAFNGRYIATPLHLGSTRPAISKAQAEAIVGQEFSVPAHELSARLLIYVDDAETAHLAWLVRYRRGLDENWHTFVDAGTGAILKRYNHVMYDGPVVGSGVDLSGQTRTLNVYQLSNQYFLIDASKPMFDANASRLPQEGKGVIYTFDTRNADSTLYFITSSDPNSWSDRAAVSAAANGALVYDFYHQVYGRNAIDGKGGTMNLVVNFKQNFNNAFWNGQFMVFGNGDGNNFSDLAGALDVTGHEMTHGVVERTANPVYENQPGALNESFADVFGVLFEFWVEGSNGDWLLGEDVTTPNIPGDALRNMEDPGAANVAFNGQQPGRMSEYRNLPNTPEGDNGGVHINSGIPNRAFYLFATSPDVGLDNAGKVYYHVLTNYLTRNSQFIDCRLAVLKAIDDIFGANSAQATAMKNAAAAAFDAVEIFDGDATPPPPVQPPVQGQEYLAVIDASSHLLYRFDLQTQQFTQVSTAPLYSRPTVTDDGSFIIYVDQTNNLHLAASDGSSDQTLTNSGGFANVAISPNGRYLAATSTFFEPNIYVFDLQDPSGNSDRVIQLYTPTYAQGETTGNVLFADRMDWTSDSEIIMYDAYNVAVNARGDTLDYWDINLLHVASENIIRLFPPQPAGVDIGNPVFASNTDNIIALDYVENNQVTVYGVNLNTGDIGQITFNQNSLASPTFSNDDRKVYYHFIDDNGASIWAVNLREDGITGDGNDMAIITGGIFPVDFTVGSRPTSVEDKSSPRPKRFILHQNYPNPFNPQTTISYELPEAARVTVRIFNLLGGLVDEIFVGQQAPGYHTLRWNGLDRDGKPVASGVYFYQLKAQTEDGKGVHLVKKMMLLR